MYRQTIIHRLQHMVSDCLLFKSKRTKLTWETANAH
uniref:Uncharacterized protein n=1 Tax=Rhizophora mucronata TaxID=61149 RepID=A0A2P2NBQ6_RHIMU